MKRWSWLLAMALSVSALALVGCGGDDDEDTAAATEADTGTTTTGGSTTGGSTTSGGTTGTDTGTSTHPPITTPIPSITSQVLLDYSPAVDGGDSVTLNSDPTPAAGTVTITASWTAIDLMTGGTPIDIPLEFRVNQGVSGAGSFVNSGHPSPFTGGVGMPASVKCKIQVVNNIPDSTATVHLRAVWNAD